jgi:thymidylate synthase (FAD)
MQVTLISPIQDILKVMTLACDTCVTDKPKGIPDLKRVLRVLRSGHLSIAEHVQVTFAISGVSRVLMAQLTRHRIASYSIQSQRSVEVSGIVVPKSIEQNKEALDVFMGAYIGADEAYANLLRLGIPKEDARYISPGGTPTNILFSCNLRALMEISPRRLCARAQTEIRELFTEIRRIMIDTYGKWLAEFLKPPCDDCKEVSCPKE